MMTALLLLVVMLGSSVGVAGQTKNRLDARTLQTVTLPWERGALDYSDFFDTTAAHYGDCDRSNPVDAKAVRDQVCIQRGGICTVGWTKPGEWLAYDLYLDDSVTTTATAVDITIRASSINSRRQFRVRMEGGSEMVWNTPGEGFDVFRDFKWENAPIPVGTLGSNLPLRILVEFISGSINVCAIRVEDSDSDDNTAMPARSPTRPPTRPPTKSPTQNPKKSPTNRPTLPALAITFNPGDLTVSENGLLLSTGLTSRIIAEKEQPVRYLSGFGGQSSIDFHLNPDAGATYADERAGNEGGWIYVSNSEIRENTQQGGVGAFTFDKNGNVIDYRMVLTKTRANCGGGRTPWGAWISCEEVSNIGQNWQVDPTGVRQSSVPITLGIDGGQFESFAYDVRNLDVPRFYVTEDNVRGALQRFTPDSPNWNDPWGILYSGGTTHYLLLYPVAFGSDGYAIRGVFSWTTNRDGAKENAERFYPNTEGIDVAEHELFFVSKRFKTMYVLNLDDLTYTNSTTRSGLFDGQPDQLQRILGDDSNDLLYFTEDGGRDPGIHCRNEVGQFFTLLESPVYDDESTGLAFSPDGIHLYFALQETGLLYDITRTDLLPFQAKSLNVKFHAVNGY
jgi:hypothetical protein